MKHDHENDLGMLEVALAAQWPDGPEVRALQRVRERMRDLEASFDQMHKAFLGKGTEVAQLQARVRELEARQISAFHAGAAFAKDQKWASQHYNGIEEAAQAYERERGQR